MLFRFVPEYDVSPDKVTMKGPKGVGPYVDSVKDKFKELIGKDLAFEEKKEEEKKEDKTADSVSQ